MSARAKRATKTEVILRAPTSRVALMLGGGGARGAYQAGVLRGIAQHFPDLKVPIITGISAGAVNTTHLAAHSGSLRDASEDLVRLWLSLSPDQVYELHAGPLMKNVVTWGTRLVSGGTRHAREPIRGMMNTDPLRHFLERALERNEDGTLPGIQRKIARGDLHAVAVSATSYTTGQSVTWVEGRNIEHWQRPQRRSEEAKLTVEHVMASSALPMLFPAVQVGNDWYGDGGIRLTAPLSPPLHLGASRILTIATKYQKTAEEAGRPQTSGYPPPAQVLGVLYSSIFLDLVEEDILRLKKVNRLLEHLPPEHRDSMRIVNILVMRPSRDLGRLAREFEPRLPTAIRYLTRGLGTKETSSPDFISLVLFQEDYVRRLIELGEADAEAQIGKIREFLEEPNGVTT